MLWFLEDFLCFLFQSSLTLFTMGMGLSLGIFLIAFTFTLHTILPFYLYWYCPAVSLTIVLIVNLTLPLTHKALDESQALLKIWPTIAHNAGGKWFSNNERKTLGKKLKFLRPLRLYAGVGRHTLFLLKKSTKRTFYWVMIEQAVNIIIGMNWELFKDIG